MHNILEMLQSITIVDVLTGLVLSIMAVYLLLFTKYLSGTERPDFGKYFRAMFEGYRTSTLRFGFRVVILIIEYILGVIAITFISIAYYPASVIRWLMNFIFISQKRVQEELQEEEYKRTKEKLRDRND